jgi:hypothetical protein
MAWHSVFVKAAFPVVQVTKVKHFRFRQSRAEIAAEFFPGADFMNPFRPEL